MLETNWAQQVCGRLTKSVTLFTLTLSCINPVPAVLARRKANASFFSAVAVDVRICERNHKESGSTSSYFRAMRRSTGLTCMMRDIGQAYPHPTCGPPMPAPWDPLKKYLFVLDERTMDRVL